MKSHAAHAPADARRLSWHWAEYAIEATGLALFMLSAAAFACLCFHPESPVTRWAPQPLAQRTLMGLAMACTCLFLVHHPWARRSGAHFNPALSLAFWSLGRVATHDAAGYMVAQFTGALLGMGAAFALLGPWLSHPAIGFIATRPGPAGAGVAWVAEFLMSGLVMSVVLLTTASPRWHARTGRCVALLIFLFITLESPLSGMSLNPARTFASLVAAGDLTPFWIYATAPVAGMLAATPLASDRRQPNIIRCARLQPGASSACLFCAHQEVQRARKQSVRTEPLPRPTQA